jgi:hypothetical protein
MRNSSSVQSAHLKSLLAVLDDGTSARPEVRIDEFDRPSLDNTAYTTLCVVCWTSPIGPAGELAAA